MNAEVTEVDVRGRPRVLVRHAESQVRQTKVLGFGQRLADARIAAPDHAHPPVGEQLGRREVGLQIGGHDHEIDRILAQAIHRGGVQPHELQLDPRRLIGHARHQGLQQQEHHIVAGRDAEGPDLGRRYEAAARVQQVLDALQLRTKLGRQLLGKRRQLELAADPHQELVLEQVPEAGQGPAHRRLAEPHPLAGAGHVPLDQQGVERDQEVQIELGKVHRSPPR